MRLFLFFLKNPSKQIETPKPPCSILRSCSAVPALQSCCCCRAPFSRCPFFFTGGGRPREGGGTAPSAGDGPGHPESRLPPGARALNPHGIRKGKQAGSPKPAPCTAAPRTPPAFQSRAHAHPLHSILHGVPAGTRRDGGRCHCPVCPPTMRAFVSSRHVPPFSPSRLLPALPSISSPSVTRSVAAERHGAVMEPDILLNKRFFSYGNLGCLSCAFLLPQGCALIAQPGSKGLGQCSMALARCCACVW